MTSQSTAKLYAGHWRRLEAAAGQATPASLADYLEQMRRDGRPYQYAQQVATACRHVAAEKAAAGEISEEQSRAFSEVRVPAASTFKRRKGPTTHQVRQALALYQQRAERGCRREARDAALVLVLAERTNFDFIEWEWAGVPWEELSERAIKALRIWSAAQAIDDPEPGNPYVWRRMARGKSDSLLHPTDPNYDKPLSRDNVNPIVRRMGRVSGVNGLTPTVIWRTLGKTRV